MSGTPHERKNAPEAMSLPALLAELRAAKVDAHPETIRRQIRAGTIPSFRIGARVYVPRAWFDQLFAINESDRAADEEPERPTQPADPAEAGRALAKQMKV